MLTGSTVYKFDKSMHSVADTASVISGWLDDEPSQLRLVTSVMVYTFFEEHPDFFEVMNKQGNDLVISEMVVAYACGVTLGSPYANADKITYFRYDTFPHGLLITSYFGESASLVIPNTVNGLNVVVIVEEVFFGHSELTSVTLPTVLMMIDTMAFKNSGLTGAIFIPASVKGMGSHVFKGCTKLTFIHVEVAEDDIVFGPNNWATDWNPDNIPVIYESVA